MPPELAQSHPLFRRAMLGGAVLTLVLFAWTVWMIVHFNAVPASVRIGPATAVKIASVVLPGPLLLTFLAWSRSSRVSRVLGWAALFPAVGLAGVFAVYTTLVLRPPFSPREYDAAAKEAETTAVARLNADAGAIADGTAARERFKQQPPTREELADLSRRIRAAAARIRQAGQDIKGMRQAIVAPFEARSVSKRRTDEFARLYMGPLTEESMQRSYTDLVATYESFARRLDTLVEHWGRWQWIGNGEVRFDDSALGKAFDGLP